MKFWKKLKNAVEKTDKTKDELQAIGVPIPLKVSIAVEAANLIASLLKKKDK